METVLLETRGSIAIISINRPEAMNALNTDVLRSLENMVDKVEEDDAIQVAIITGSGRAFVAGADIGEMKDLNAIGAKKFSIFGNAVFSKIENMSKPVIAAVNGFALGGGCELSLSCDIRLAAENAKFGQPEVGLGITPGFGGTQRLARTVGIAKAKELIYTAKVITAEEAKAIGLVSYVVPKGEVLEEAIKLADMIAKNAQVAVRQAKKAINMGMQADIHTGVSYETEAFGICFATEDQKDGMEAFIAKRKLDGFKNK